MPGEAAAETALIGNDAVVLCRVAVITGLAMRHTAAGAG